MVFSGDFSGERAATPNRIQALATFEDLASPTQEGLIAGFLLVSGSTSALEIFDAVRPEEFTDPLAQAVVEASLGLFQSSRDINPQSVTLAMREAETLIDVGGIAAITVCCRPGLGPSARSLQSSERLCPKTGSLSPSSRLDGPGS